MNMDPTSKELKTEIPGRIRLFKDGSVQRLFGSPYVAPTLDDPQTGVSSKDVLISTTNNLSARLYLPKPTTTNHPILVYFHGGSFCIESAFGLLHHRFITTLASTAQVVVVSVEYSLAPEHPLPAAYDDCWAALNLTATLSDPWLKAHGDLDAVFVGGDSAGGNIVHNMIMRAGEESLAHGVNILGAFLSQPYFLHDKNAPQLEMGCKIWDFVYPNAPGGLDSPLINPMGSGAPSLSGVGCRRVLVVVAEKDELREAGVGYYDAVKKSGFEGNVELIEVKGEGHCFQLFNPDTENAKVLVKRLASFLHK